MTLKSVILEQLDREAGLTNRALERVPENRNHWKPHPKSMPLGVLSHLVATMPTWISMMVKMDELDIKPKNGGHSQAERNINSVKDLLAAHDKAVADAHQDLSTATEDFLQTPWKLLEAGKVVQEQPRYRFILDNFTHLAHHRGQLTVYLRLNDAPVPAIYGPSADDHRF